MHGAERVGLPDRDGARKMSNELETVLAMLRVDAKIQRGNIIDSTYCEECHAFAALLVSTSRRLLRLDVRATGAASNAASKIFLMAQMRGEAVCVSDLGATPSDQL